MGWRDHRSNKHKHVTLKRVKTEVRNIKQNKRDGEARSVVNTYMVRQVLTSKVTEGDKS